MDTAAKNLKSYQDKAKTLSDTVKEKEKAISTAKGDVAKLKSRIDEAYKNQTMKMTRSITHTITFMEK